MTDERDLEPGVPVEERARLAEVSDQLERARPLPRAAFRGELRRLLLSGRSRRASVASSRWRVLLATYSGLGAVLLAVAVIGLAGAGPFGA